MNPFLWIRDLFGFIGWFVAMGRKDQHGKMSGFLWSSDNPAVTSFLDGTPPFGRTAFISFERDSLELAERFEADLRRFEIMPWRYEPIDHTDFPVKSQSDLLEQVEAYRAEHPDVVESLTATLRRCTVVLFLVSRASLNSGFCALEAFTAAVIHSYGRPEQAPIYIILEEPGLPLPPMLDGFWSKEYWPGLESAIAELIAIDIDVHSVRLEALERHRSRIYR
jgi:hypothetical protein